MPFSRSQYHFLNLRHHSLSRGNLLVLTSLLMAILMSDFPNNRPTMFLIIPTVLSMIGTGETVRCMRIRWDYYHAGVMLCLYMDLLVIFMILFFLIYPYGHFLTVSR